MNGGRVAIVLTDEAQDCADWRDANRTWLGRDGVDISDFPKLAAFKAAMEARPSAFILSSMLIT